MKASEINWSRLGDLELRGYLNSLDDDIAEAADNETKRRRAMAGNPAQKTLDFDDATPEESRQ